MVLQHTDDSTFWLSGQITCIEDALTARDDRISALRTALFSLVSCSEAYLRNIFHELPEEYRASVMLHVMKVVGRIAKDALKADGEHR